MAVRTPSFIFVLHLGHRSLAQEILYVNIRQRTFSQFTVWKYVTNKAGVRYFAVISDKSDCL